ncbi:TlpA family protein disulfide reductase [Sphingobacterium faecale]|uniref:Redoxin domain-containing protein n=1 Tax=Sphingobacterium faecale TaxID=2803775 RepID=A0ABS1R384_9SPHI|nr:redoxin domain-containing protein [Sphingobacterium faecale]MBL1408684.1 redoxin domain-containing protein [Sphingobacterium faecale]
MKMIFIVLVLFLLWNKTNAQYQALQIGEKMPDFEFKIQNYKTPTARISDFKGKLVFFDFWSTYCSSCIAGFPKMEKLQEEFGDQIIIILVNMRETQEEVDKRLKARKSIAPELKRMPSIIGEEAFAQLFPHYYAGNYVWIDPQGILRLNTAVTKNIHAKKIQEVLDGKEISFLTINKQYGLTDNEPSLLNIINTADPKNADSYSILSPVNLDYYPGGGQLVDQKDSISNTIRNTYINRGFANLYNYALQESLDKEWESKIFGPTNTRHHLDRFRFLVKDTTLYDNLYLLPKNKHTDEYVTRSQYCYEQVLPQNVTKEEAQRYMKEDLDRYFGIRYGCKVTVEKVEIPCYYLTSLTNPIKLSEDEIKTKLKALNFNEFGSTMDYNSLVSSYFYTIGESPYVFLGLGVPKEFTAIIPKWDQWKKNSTFQDLQQVLGLYNLKLVKGTKRINMIVVRD